MPEFYYFEYLILLARHLKYLFNVIFELKNVVIKIIYVSKNIILIIKIKRAKITRKLQDLKFKQYVSRYFLGTKSKWNKVLRVFLKKPATFTK